MPSPYLQEDETDLQYPSFNDEEQLDPNGIPVAPPSISPQTAAPPQLDMSRLQVASKKLAELSAQRPTLQKPAWWKAGIAGALGGLAGYTNAAGRTKHPIDVAPAVEGLRGTAKFHRDLAGWNASMQGAQQQQASEQQNLADTMAVRKQLEAEPLTQAQTQHALSQSELAKQQAATLKEDGKRAPKGDYIAIPGGGLFNAAEGKWIKQPVDKTQVIPLDAAWVRANAPYLKPDETGEYTIPAGAAGSLIKTEGPKSKKLTFEHFTDENTGDVTTVGYDTETGQEVNRNTIKGIAKKRPPTSTVGITLSPEAIQQNAERYNTTGVLPSLGMGSSGGPARRDILNKAAELGGNVATNSQEYKATQATLNSLQRQSDQVNAFEKTASSNLDLAAGLSEKVGRTGSPLINEWVLAAKGKLAGDSNTRQFENSVRTASDEYAKVVTNNGASGNTTDAARAQYSKLLSAADNPKTFKDTVALMKKEMGNRKQGFADQLKEIRSRRSQGQDQNVTITPGAPNVVKWGRDAQRNPIRIQ